jgi:hypothetical protein
MDIQQFWKLIDAARGQVADSAHTEAVAARAAMLLSALPPEEIIASQRALSACWPIPTRPCCGQLLT